MLKSKQEFIDYCVDACQNDAFVNSKHHPSGLPMPHKDARSVNLWGNAEMEKYLLAGDFRVHAYADSEANHSPEFYVLTPNDPAVVPGSGVPRFSTTPTTQCDVFAVPSGYIQGWHCYAYDSVKVKTRENAGKLSLLTELL
jgi:hypothetical protein